MKRIQTEFQCSFLKFLNELSVNLGGIKGGGNSQITKANRMHVCACVYMYLNVLHKLKENDILL